MDYAYLKKEKLLGGEPIELHAGLNDIDAVVGETSNGLPVIITGCLMNHFQGQWKFPEADNATHIILNYINPETGEAMRGAANFTGGKLTVGGISIDRHAEDVFTLRVSENIAIGDYIAVDTVNKGLGKKAVTGENYYAIAVSDSWEPALTWTTGVKVVEVKIRKGILA